MIEEEMENLLHAALHCPDCAAANLPQRKFCAKCGASLWETCFQCGSISAAGETYCGGCGTNLVEVAAGRMERLEADFHEVAQLRSECQFGQAIALLIPISKDDHPRLAEHVSRAKRLVRQLTAERDRRRAEVDDDYHLASGLFDACNFEEAARILESVPASLQSEAIVTLAAQIATRRQEITACEEELHEAVREKRLVDLPSRIDRLLTLNRNHAYAKRLAGQVQQCLIDGAKKRLALHDYDQASRLLEQVAPASRTPENEQLHRHATELAWLTWDLRHAPVVDETLIAVAERLRKLAPNDKRSMELCAQLRRHVKAGERKPNREPLAWVRPPQQTPLGVPVDWLSGFRRLPCIEKMDRSDLDRSHGRFAVACGLALAGIGQAAIEIDLLSAEPRGLWGHLARLIQPRDMKRAWGIDVGASALKAVELVWDEARQQAVIEAAILIEHAKLLNHAANDAEKRRLVSETLKAFLERHPLKNEQVCVGLPGRMTLSRQIDLFSMDASKIAKAVEFEARVQFPFPLEQLAWDFQILEENGSNNDDTDGTSEPVAEKSSKALVIAARHSTTRHFLDTFQRLGVRVDLLQTDFVALHNFLMFEHSLPGDDARPGQLPPALAAIDIGSEVTNIVVSSPESLWFHSCGVAGHSFTRALVKEFNLTIARAEQLKRHPHSAERLSDLYAALTPVFGDLLGEVQHALAAYAQARPNCPIQHVLGVGGGAMLHGLFRYLRCGR
jgi:type IV pilus assembly protein PilM